MKQSKSQQPLRITFDCTIRQLTLVMKRPHVLSSRILSARHGKINSICEDYRLTIEYKHLRQNAPGGVFVIPSVNHLRIWSGVIFVRRGHYANGVFKFRCDTLRSQDKLSATCWEKMLFLSRICECRMSWRQQQQLLRHGALFSLRIEDRASCCLFRES